MCFSIYENDWELLVIVMGSDIRRAILRNVDLNANVKKKINKNLCVLVLGGIMKINSHNEWDTLKEVIVGNGESQAALIFPKDRKYSEDELKSIIGWLQ